jgi:hypothetical protein
LAGSSDSVSDLRSAPRSSSAPPATFFVEMNLNFAFLQHSLAPMKELRKMRPPSNLILRGDLPSLQTHVKIIILDLA